MEDFYDRLSPFYHLIFEDWDATIATQARQLRAVIESEWGGARSILDVSCGIGTQAIGLAGLGYAVTASDLSAKAVARARREAATRGLEIDFSVGDMRAACAHHAGDFDVVISCDNSVPHLLTDADIGVALASMHACLKPGGGCLLTVRPYDAEPRGKGLFKPFGVREFDGKRYLVFQLWDFDGDHYDFSMYFIEDDRSKSEAATRVLRSRYYAIAPARLMTLLEDAGFKAVRRLDDAFFQPVLIGTR